jgi:hypothetical protein
MTPGDGLLICDVILNRGASHGEGPYDRVSDEKVCRFARTADGSREYRLPHRNFNRRKVTRAGCAAAHDDIQI